MSLSELGPCKVVIDAISPEVCSLEDPKRGAVINAIRNKMNRIQNRVNTIAQLVDKLEVCCVCGKQRHGTAQELSRRSKNMAYPSLSSSFISYAVTVQGKPAATITPRIMPPTKEQQLNSPSSYAMSEDWSGYRWNRNELATQGYNVGNVEITVGTSYSAVGEALSAGTADAGFISGGTYVTYDDDCDVLLTAQRKAINKDSLNAKDWNDGTEEAFTDNLTTYYRSIILAGPSTKGQELAAKVNAGQKLTWDDLNGATWAVMGASSASGYIYPSLWLYNNYGKQISDLANVVQSDSYTTSMSRLAAGQVDVIVGFAHMRAKYAANWMSKFGGTDDCYKQTAVLAVTDQIMDDTICVSKNSDIMSEGFKKAFADACINIGKSEDGLKVLNVLSHIGYQYAQSSDYDAERAAQNMLKK